MGLYTRKKVVARPRVRARAAAEVVSGLPMDSPVHHLNPAAIVALARDRSGAMGMEGAPPIVTVSRNRTRCEGCKKLVFKGVRHICIYNAHHHLDTLTHEEREQLIAELTALKVGRKFTR
jgi:hypothetical protein